MIDESQKMAQPLSLYPPRFRQDACAASRFGVQGCRACADVCPHQALRFGDLGPAIDADACRRCGACAAACPTGALERAYLPDPELFTDVIAAAEQNPSVLILSCGHDHAFPSAAVGPEALRLRLPCVQMISDDLLLFAVARGAGAVFIESDERCPHWPHVQPHRAVATATAVLRSFGQDGSRVAIGSRPGPGGLDRARTPRAARGTPDVAPSGTRAERRTALLAAMAAGSSPRPHAGPLEGVVPWRHVAVDTQACTMCGACAFVCPTGALGLSRDGGSLFGRAAACIGCTLCAGICPENAITLVSVVSADAEPRLLALAPLATCTRCGRPHLPEPLVRQIEKKLPHQDGAGRAALRLCEQCKGADLIATAPTPSTRTTDNVPPWSRAGTDGPSRREFVRAAGAALTGAIAVTGCSSSVAAEEPEHRYGMVIDTKRCVGCEACVIACKAENKTPPGVNYMVVTRNMFGERPDDKPLFTAKPCFHCERPPCVDVCPVSATFKRKRDGIVVVDYDRCIGCRYCQTACPYGARFFDFGEDYAAETADGPYLPPSPEYNQFRPRVPDASPIANVRKCTFCLHLQDEHGEYDRKAGRWPACAKTCTGHAIHFGDFMDPESDVSRLIRERQPVRSKDELGAQPNVLYLL